MNSILIKITCRQEVTELLQNGFRPRKADQMEMDALGFKLNAARISQALPNLWALKGAKGNLLAIGGFTPTTPTIHTPWLLCTNELNRQSLTIIHAAKRLIYEHFQANPRCSTLCNLVMVANKKAVRWIRAMGFTINDPIPVGDKGTLFHAFKISREEAMKCAPR